MNLPARPTGILLQGIILGILLFLALLVMASLDEGMRIFRYQGF